MNIRNFFCLACLLMPCAFASAENTLSVQDVVIPAGGTYTALVTISNDVELSLVAFDVLLPGDVTLTGTTRTGITLILSDPEDEESDKLYAVSKNATGFVNSTRVTITNNDNIAFPAAKNQSLVKIKLSSKEGYTGPLYISNANCANSEGKQPLKFAVGTIGKGGYSSFGCEQNVQIEGATAYYGAVSSDAIELTETKDNIVYKQTGAILKGTEGTTIYATSIEIKNSDIAPYIPASTSLSSAERGKEVSSNSVYVLSTEEDGTGFYKYTGTSIPAGKAYIDGSLISGATRAMIRIGSEATGIDAIEDAASAESESYDLFGRKSDGAKGQMMIENGKKVIRF